MEWKYRPMQMFTEKLNLLVFSDRDVMFSLVPCFMPLLNFQLTGESILSNLKQ